MHARVVIGTSVLAALGFACVAACGSFGSDATPSAGAGEGGAPSPDARPDAPAPDASAPDGATCATARCADADLACQYTSFAPPPPDNDTPWGYEPKAAPPVVADGVLVASTPNPPMYLRTVAATAAHVKLTVELDVAVDDLDANVKVGLVSWVGVGSDELFLAARSDGLLVVCPLPAQGGAEKPCSPPLARWEPGTWMHVAWTVEQRVGSSAQSRVVLACTTSTEWATDGVALASATAGDDVELHVGVTTVYGTGKAKVRVDNLARTITPLP